MLRFDLTSFKSDLKDIIPHSRLKDKRLSATWTRTWFGLKLSPEHASTFYYLAEDFIRGNHLDHTNPLRWDSIELNLIGEENYNPTFSNVFKWDKVNSRIAGDYNSICG